MWYNMYKRYNKYNKHTKYKMYKKYGVQRPQAVKGTSMLITVKEVLTTWVPIILFAITLIFLTIAVLARRRDNDRLVDFSLYGIGTSVCLLVVATIITGICLALEIL